MESKREYPTASPQEIFFKLRRCPDLNAYPLIMREVTAFDDMKEIVRLYIEFIKEGCTSNVDPIYYVKIFLLTARPQQILTKEQYEEWEKAINAVQEEQKQFT